MIDRLGFDLIFQATRTGLGMIGSFYFWPFYGPMPTWCLHHALPPQLYAWKMNIFWWTLSRHSILAAWDGDFGTEWSVGSEDYITYCCWLCVPFDKHGWDVSEGKGLTWWNEASPLDAMFSHDLPTPAVSKTILELLCGTIIELVKHFFNFLFSPPPENDGSKCMISTVYDLLCLKACLPAQQVLQTCNTQCLLNKTNWMAPSF